MTKFLPSLLLFWVLMPVAGHAQMLCQSQVGVCALPNGIPNTPCACFTPNGPVPGVVIGPPMGVSQVSQLPHYCCTLFGKIGPLQNYSIPPGGACSVVLPNGIPTGGQACY